MTSVTPLQAHNVYVAGMASVVLTRAARALPVQAGHA